MINELLVKEGYAHSSSYPPDIKYQDKFRLAEQEARKNKQGLWGETCDITPTQTKSPTSTPIKTQTSNSQNQQTPDSGSYVCNCSKTCPNLSCDEAQYQLNVCGCSQRDADDDGIACDAECQ